MSAKYGVDFLKTVAEYMVGHNGWDKVTKCLKITGGGQGRCIAEFTVTKDHLNNAGYLNNGLTATIVDIATTYALLSKPAGGGVSVDLRVSFLNTAKEGDEIIVDANTIRAGKSLAYIDCKLLQKNDGSIVAQGGQTKYIYIKQEE